MSLLGPHLTNYGTREMSQSQNEATPHTAQALAANDRAVCFAAAVGSLECAFEALACIGGE